MKNLRVFVPGEGMRGMTHSAPFWLAIVYKSLYPHYTTKKKPPY